MLEAFPKSEQREIPLGMTAYVDKIQKLVYNQEEGAMEERASQSRPRARTCFRPLAEHLISNPKRLRPADLPVALRGPNSGVYEHHGLSLVFGPRAANEALRSSHDDTFRDLAELRSGAAESGSRRCISTGLMNKRRRGSRPGCDFNPYRNVVPLTATRTVDKDLFLVDFGAVLELLRIEYGVAVPDPDA